MRKTLRLSKKKLPPKDTRPPAPGERKAIRKRIILSNTNALEVPGLPVLNKEDCSKDSIKSNVVVLPDELVDSLRAMEAFKVGQAWGFFRRPATLIREEALELSTVMDTVAANETKIPVVERRIIYGERSTGKSVLLLQAMAMAFLKDWIVISIPECRDVTVGHTDYAPLPETNPTQYVQPVYVANMLRQLVKANRPVLSSMRLWHKHDLPVPIQDNISLDRFAELGASDPEIAWQVFQALWKELTSPSQAGQKPQERGLDAFGEDGATAPAKKSSKVSKSPSLDSSKDPLRRPPILMTMDNVSHLMTTSHYNTVDDNSKLQHIHAHDLSIVKHFIDYLSGTRTLPNGGMVLGATSSSEHAKSDALDVAIAMAEARQSQPGACLNLSDFWDPYKKIDQRCLECLDTVKVTKLAGLSRENARAVMEYWASSGMVRDRIVDTLVAEKWTLSGGGIVGELEKAVVRQRI